MFSRKKRSSAKGVAWEEDAVLLGSDDVSDYNSENILPQSTQTLDKIRKWLQPTAYNDEGCEYKKHLASHLAGTGDWLLSASAFDAWMSSEEKGILWIRGKILFIIALHSITHVMIGIPGSGKSVFAASLIHHLAEDKIPVLYFFFRHIIDANHTPLAALRDWLAQILVYSPPLQAKLFEYLEERRSLNSVGHGPLPSHIR
jgi:DNA replication protein DnaC